MTSWADLLDTRRRLVGAELHVGVYLSEGDGKIIITPLYAVSEHLYVAQGTATVLNFATPAVEFGRELREALLACEKRSWDESGLEQQTAESDPAYRASGSLSRSAFLDHYVQMGITTSEQQLEYEGEPIHSDESVYVCSELSEACTDAELGERTFLVYRCCQHLTRAEFS